MIPDPGDCVFVYGTLKRGGQYHSVMVEAGGRFLGTARMLVPYPLVLAQYPCLLDQPGKGFHVRGEVFLIPDHKGWTGLDRLEGYPEEYDRRIEEVQVNGRILGAWTYFYRQESRLCPDLSPVEEFAVGTRTES